MASVDELIADLESGAFALGVDHARWRLIARDGPKVIVAIAAPPRPRAPDEFALQLVCEGYRAAAATGVFWDVTTNTILADDLWPYLVGDEAFKTNWVVNGTRCLYIATDGLTILSKPAWPTDFPLERWRPEVGIACYLSVVRDRLYSPRYTGTVCSQRSPAA